MYPKLFADYFRRFDRRPEVFVAMPISRESEQRWTNIFRPAIKDVGLKPYRVDKRVVSDSILTDIVAGIGRARFVLVDISPEEVADRPAGPNANVMYELGLAHAIRLPEEVIVVRDETNTSDAPFDIRHIRWSRFNASKPGTARRIVRDLIKAASKAVDVTRDVIVDRVLRSLDPDMIRFLHRVRRLSAFDLYPFDSDRKGLYQLGDRDVEEDTLRRVARSLIARGILEAGNPGRPERRVYGATPEYVFTALGQAVAGKLPTWPWL